MFKCFGLSVLLFFTGVIVCMEDQVSTEELLLDEIVTLCKAVGNFELAEIYKQHYDKIRVDNEYEKKRIFRTYTSNVKVYMEPSNISKRVDSKYPVIFEDKINTCALCWGICEGKSDDSARFLCCKHKFHIRCLVNWMAIVNKSCPCCKKKIAETLQESFQKYPALMYVQAFLDK